FVFLIEDMIDLRVPLFPVGGFPGSEKILSAVPAANPANAGDIQAVTDIIVIHSGHVFEQGVHVARRVYLSPIGISWAARYDSVGAIRIRGSARKRHGVGIKDAGKLHRTEISPWNSCLVDPGCLRKSSARACWLCPRRCASQRSAAIRRAHVCKIPVDAVPCARRQGEGGVSFLDQCPLFIK